MKVSFKIELYIQYFSLHIPEELSSRAWKPRRKPNLHINQTPKNSELNVKIMVSTIYIYAPISIPHDWMHNHYFLILSQDTISLIRQERSLSVKLTETY